MSHDRAFLDNVVTQVIAFEGDGLLREHVGGYRDWAEHRTGHLAESDAASRRSEAPAAPVRDRPGTPRIRLTFNEERTLTALPERIDALEARIGEIHRRFADPDLYRECAPDVTALRAELEQLERSLADDYAQWEALESRRVAAKGGERG